jgi:hypothetical protein
VGQNSSNPPAAVMGGTWDDLAALKRIYPVRDNWK